MVAGVWLVSTLLVIQLPFIPPLVTGRFLEYFFMMICHRRFLENKTRYLPCYDICDGARRELSIGSLDMF